MTGLAIPGATRAAAATQWTKGVTVTGSRGVTRSNRTLNARSDAATSDTRPRQSSPRRVRQRTPESNPNSPAVASTPSGGSQVIGPRLPQTIGANFLGAQLDDDSPFVPPDSMGAIGPTQFLVAVNGRIRTFTRAGAADNVLNVDLDSFFADVLPAGNFTSDPRVRYDRSSERWFVTAIDIPPIDPQNHILIAVSTGSDITASDWTFFSITGPLTASLDFDTLGIDEDALYIGVNVFGNTFTTSAYVVQKSSVLGSGPIVSTAFQGLIDQNTFAGPLSPAGVDNLDTGTNEGYFIGVDGAFFGKLDVRRISNPGSGSPTISANIPLDVPVTTFPNFGVPQPNGGPFLDDLDDRLSNAVIRNGHLWTSHNIGVTATGVANVNFASGGRDGVRWYEILNLSGTPQLRQSGTIFDPSKASFNYWMPSVMVSGQGNTAFGFSRGGVDPINGFASAATAGRLPTDSLGLSRAPTVYRQSTFEYDPSQEGFERWGDYSFTSLDPTDDMTMWTIQEYASATDKWGVRIAELKAPAPVIIDGGSATPNSSSTTLTVTGRGFFEPGVAFSKHLTALITGVSLNGITSVSPTQVVLDVDTSSATDGGHTITITNPDGQEATGTMFVGPEPADNAHHDLAVTKIGAVKAIKFTGFPVVKKVAVKFQNRSPHAETITDPNTFPDLVHLDAESIDTDTCPGASVGLSPKQKTLPVTIKSKGTFTVNFQVTFDCVVDPALGTKDDPGGHADYVVHGSVDHSALDGHPDSHTIDDVCPRSATGIDPNPDGSIPDKGCGAKNPDGTLGATMYVDLYAP
jgi:hypothetical protein